MSRDEILVIPMVGVLLLLLLRVLYEPLFNILLKFLFALVLTLIIVCVVWRYLTPNGKKFARTLNSRLQEEKAVESQLFTQCQSLVNSIHFGSLMDKIQRISTFTEVAEWEKEAEAAIAKIVETIELLDEVVGTVVSQYSNVSNLTQIRFKQKYQGILEDMATKLQESIDFTPKNLEQQKGLIKELSLAKKELQLQKKEITLTRILIF